MARPPRPRQPRRPFDQAAAALILDNLRSGCYLHVAAQAAGVEPATLDAWLARASRPRCRAPLRQFAARCRQAQAQARLHAEMSVYLNDAKYWLKFGPGKEKPGQPGWSREVKPHVDANTISIDLISHPLLAQMLAALLHALDPWPAAKIAAAAQLHQLDSLAAPPAIGGQQRHLESQPPAASGALT